MRKLFVGALSLVLATPAFAQEGSIGAPGKPSVFSLVPYAGYMVYGDHFELPSGAEFSNDNSWIVGAQASFDLSRNFSLVGNFGWSKTNWEFELDTGEGTEVAAGDVGIWLYDGSLQFRLPVTAGMSTFAPFVQAGLGAIKFSTDDNDFDSSGQANIAYNVGVGADWQIMGVGVRLMAKDYISSFNWDDVADAQPANFDKDQPISHNWALTAGLKFSF